MESKTYLFQPEKKILKQGFFMTDSDNNVIYEAKMLKQPLIGSMQFNFINHLTNKEEEHKVGHTVTTTMESGAELLDAFSTKSYFKYDGKNIWDYLHKVGIRIESHLIDRKIGMKYYVTLEKKEMAEITMTSPQGKSIITSRYYFNVKTREENLDLAFLVTFAIARTEQTFYN